MTSAAALRAAADKLTPKKQLKKNRKKEEQRNKISFIKNYRKNAFGTVTGA